jgi:hypothetical protein
MDVLWCCRLLLRNHEALAALEAAVTKGPQQTPKRRGRWAKKDAAATPTPDAAAGEAGAAAASEGAANGDNAADGTDGTAAAAAAAGGEDGSSQGAAAAAAAASGGGGDGGADAAAAPGEQLVVAQGNAWRRLLNLIMQLRKVVNHPFMMPDSEPRGDGTSTLPELLDASGVVWYATLLPPVAIFMRLASQGDTLGACDRGMTWTLCVSFGSARRPCKTAQTKSHKLGGLLSCLAILALF